VHTFQKDFDDYATYQEFIEQNPEYNTQRTWDLRGPLGFWDQFFLPQSGAGSTLPADTRYLPEGVDLEKYEKRRLEKRQSEAEKAEKRRSLESSRSYLTDYLEENPEDSDAQADLETIEQEIAKLA